jgi:hypothetical protein
MATNAIECFKAENWGQNLQGMTDEASFDVRVGNNSASTIVDRRTGSDAVHMRGQRGLRVAPHASATPGLPLSTANVFSVDTLACGSVTSEMTRMRVVISLGSRSTLT